MPGRGLLLVFVVAALALGAAAAVTADGPRPAVALGSDLLHRLEVGLAVFAAVYLLGMVVRLAWHGQLLRRVELPGGTAVETPAALEQAADQFDEFRTATDERFSALESSIEELDRRVEAIVSDREDQDLAG